MLEIKIPAHTDRLGEVLAFVGAAMRGTGIDMKQENNINIAVEEVFVNIAHYAYPSGEGDVTVSLPVTPGSFVIEFRDSGLPYDPLSRCDPDITLSAAEREIGGLGIFMVKQLMDSVSYRYENECNVLTISKELTYESD